MALKAIPHGWITVREAVEHPDHPGVVGDLARHEETGIFNLLVYYAGLDNYVSYTVPHAWAQKVAA